jgi:hypothetical protein
MGIAIDVSHDCEQGGGVKPGAIAVQAKASSSCCGAALAEGGTDEAGHTCTSCGKAATKVMGPRTAHWTCTCGQPRSQAVTEPQDG